MGSSLPDHDWVSPACIHRQHEKCEADCPICGQVCMCVCHRWLIPIQGQPVEER